MKSLKLNIFLILALFFTACSGAPLDSGTPPAGKLFAQIALETPSGSQDFIVESYTIHLDKAAFVLGNISLLKMGEASTMKFHEGEDHEHSEPTSCDFDGSIPKFFYLDLLQDPELPCVTLDEGSYDGLRFEIRPGVESETEGLPSGETASFVVEGTATREGVEYAFTLQGNLETPVEILQALSLTGDAHHLTLETDSALWFHGLEFALLDQEEGRVKIDEAHNLEAFEHLIEHFLASFSL